MLSYDNLTEKEKDLVSAFESDLADVDSQVVTLLMSNVIGFCRLMHILELRTDIRKHDKEYIACKLSTDEWKSAEKEYDPMQEFLSIFGDPLSGKSNGKDK
jgi:hypothetical protein